MLGIIRKRATVGLMLFHCDYAETTIINYYNLIISNYERGYSTAAVTNTTDTTFSGDDYNEILRLI